MNKYWWYILLLVACSQENGENNSRQGEEKKTTMVETAIPAPEKKFPDMEQLKTGDIIFVHSSSDLSLPISKATHSDYTHCGIFYGNDSSRIMFVVEAADSSGLSLASQFFEHTADDQVLVMRLKSRREGLTEREIKKLREAVKKRSGLPYDGKFMWDDEKMYCSELVYKLYLDMGIDLGKVKKIKDFDLSSPEVKKEIEKRYNGQVPYAEPVVAPIDLVHSTLLDTVYYAK